MAIASTCVWEVRSGGSDQNGGGFVAGAGTDYSQQNAAQVAVADAVANGTTTLTSATAGFTAAAVGNVVYLAGGTGSLAGTRRQIVTYNGPMSVNVDATVPVGTGLTARVGGCLATLKEVSLYAQDGNVCYGTGTQNLGATVNPWNSGRIEGYATTRGDGGLWTHTGTAAVPMIQTTIPNGSTLMAFANLDLNANSTATKCFFEATQTNTGHTNCTYRNATSHGFHDSHYGSPSCVDCKFTGNGGGGYVRDPGLGGLAAFSACKFAGNGGGGCISNSATIQAIACTATGNTGVGILQSFAAGTAHIERCTAFGNTSHGFTYGRGGFQYEFSQRCINCISYGNGGYGFYNPASSPQFGLQLINCAGGSNTSGFSAQGSAQQKACVTLTANPFANSGTGDFSLNATAGGGAACRGTGLPTLTDIGAVQHADPAGGGGAGVTWFGGFG